VDPERGTRDFSAADADFFRKGDFNCPKILNLFFEDGEVGRSAFKGEVDNPGDNDTEVKESEEVMEGVEVEEIKRSSVDFARKKDIFVSFEGELWKEAAEEEREAEEVGEPEKLLSVLPDKD